MQTEQEFMSISKALESHHEIFSQLWLLGKPTITTSIDSAAVAWNKDGECVQFLFNPDFMDKLTVEDVCFVVAHECSHVILGHGKRLAGLHGDIGNIAADIAINELLLRGFGFKVSNWLMHTFGLCTIQSIFKDRAGQIEKNREFEYYYREIMKDAKVQSLIAGSGIKTLDYHGSIPVDVPMEIKEIIEGLCQEDAENLKEQIKGQGNDSPAAQWIEATLKPKAKEDWRKVIQNWTIKEFRTRNKTQWKRTDRRFIDIQRRNPRLIIPSIGPIDNRFGERIDMVFFMDVSASCYHEAQAFFAAAKTIPDDKFVIDAKAFDTNIIPINLDDTKLPHGGGTWFHHLETYCLSKPQYPSVVFVLTDGGGSDVTPKYPERWHVFLTPFGSRQNFKGVTNFHEFRDFDGNAI